MGSDMVYRFDSEDNYECPDCETLIHVEGWIREYPVGAYDAEDINVVELEYKEDDCHFGANLGILRQTNNTWTTIKLRMRE